MTETEQQLLNDVMRRVRFIYFGRFLLNGDVLKVVVFAVSVIVVLCLTHITHIVRNMSLLPDYTAYLSYLYDAYLNTSIIIQSITVLGLIAIMWLVVDMSRNIKIFHLRWTRI